MEKKNYWTSIIKSCRSCCFCFPPPEEVQHGRLETPSQESPPTFTLPRVFDNAVIDFEVPDNFAMEALDTPDLHWNLQPSNRPRTRDDQGTQNYLRKVYGAGGELEFIHRAGSGKTDEQEDSKSRESGYGYSIEESLGSSSESEYFVEVTEDKSKATFKLVVQNRTKCWNVFRRQLEFVLIQEHIKKEVGSIYEDIPVGRRTNTRDLQAFLQKIISDSELLKLSKVREFLLLDSHKSISSDESSASIVSAVTKQPRSKTYPHNLQPSHCSQLSQKLSHKLVPEDFTFLNVIGKGSFGKVVLARMKADNKVYAVKVLNKKLILRKNETAHVLSERSVLTRVLRHPYVVQLHYAFTTPTKIFLVLNYCNGGELFYHLQRERIFDENRARFYAAEICCALTYMHSMGIIYRDLKPENILLDREGHIILTDFGLCKEGLATSSFRTSTFCGTPEYLAPEILLKQPYTRSIDWWTYGAVLYEMLYGLPPFYCKDVMAMYNAIINKPLKLRSTISPKAKEILFLLLQKSPTKRLGAGLNDGKEIKNHEFFSSIKWSLLESRGIAPTFVPNVKSDDDTRNIDPVFLNEPIALQTCNSRNTSISEADNLAFRAFSYTAFPVENETER